MGGELPLSSIALAILSVAQPGAIRYNARAMRFRRFPSLSLPSRLPPADRFGLLVIAAAFLGAGLVLARQIRHGAIVSPDSVFYLAAARSLLEGNGFILWDGRPFVLWPPLYPIALASASFGALDQKEIAGPLNAVLFGLIIFATGRWLSRRGVPKPLTAWACFSIALAAPLTYFAAGVLSDALFILLTIIALMQMDNYMRTGKWSTLLWISVFTSLAWLTRYIGAVTLFVIMAFLARQPGIRMPDKAKRIAVYGVIASTPMALWIIRNARETGTITGARRSHDHGVYDTLTDILGVVGGWMLPKAPEFIHTSVAPFIAGMFLSAVTLGIWMTLTRRFGAATEANKMLLALIGSYALAFVATSAMLVVLNQTWHGVQERHFIPAYIPLLTAAVLLMDKLFKLAQAHNLLGNWGNLPMVGRLVPTKARGISPAAALLGLLLLSWSGCNFALTVDQIRDNNSGIGIGYSAPRWAESELIRHIRESDIQDRILSNEAYVIYFYTKKPANFITYRTDEAAISSELAYYGNGTYVAFFDGDYPRPYSMSYFRGRAEVETVVEFTDGILLRVNMDKESSFPARYEAIERNEPVVRSVWDLYLDGRTLTYAKSPCSYEDAAAKFFLHIAPLNAADLQDERKVHGFDNLDFRFERYGARFGEACLATVTLPAYPVGVITTGQFSSAGRHWEENFPVPN